MRDSTLKVTIGDVTYHVDDPKLSDGLKASITAIEESVDEGNVSRIRHRDRINLDRAKDRESFAERAGTDPAHLNEVRDRVLDHLTPLAQPADVEDVGPVSVEVMQHAEALLRDPTLLERFGEEVMRARGYAGDLRYPRLVYLVLTSRLTRRPANALIGGPSSAGKTFLMEAVADCFPAAATYAIGAMSERALVYTDAEFQHRHLLISEAAALHRDGVGALIVRSVIWGNCLEYEITEQDADGVWRTRRISKPGPTGLITSSVKGIESELETRMLTITVPDDEGTTRAILRARAERAKGSCSDEPDLRAWHEAQRWLADEGVHEVAIPFAGTLASLFPAKLVRARRDFEQLITLIEASAILHQRQRATDDHGRIIAADADYRLVYDLAASVFGAAASEGVTPTVRQTVATVKELTNSADDATVSAHQLGMALNLGKAAVSRRVNLALRGGFLVNEEPVKGKPSKLRVGDPLPEEANLPAPDAVLDTRATPETMRTVEHPPENPHGSAETTVRIGHANTPTVRIEHSHGSNGACEQGNPRSGAETRELFECSHEFEGVGDASANGHRATVIAQAKTLAALTPDELAAYRLELAAAPTHDPHLAADREALALFDAMRASGAIA